MDHLEQLIEDIHVREVALGAGYIVTGQTPPQAPSLAQDPAGSWARQAGARTLLPRPDVTARLPRAARG